MYGKESIPSIASIRLGWGDTVTENISQCEYVCNMYVCVFEWEGGALVPAAHWYEPLIDEEAVTAMTIGRDRKVEKMRKRNLDRARSLW